MVTEYAWFLREETFEHWRYDIIKKRVVVAIIASFPVAVVASLSLGLAIDLGDAFSTAFFWIVWGASIYFSLRESEPRRVFGRTAIAYAIAALSLPLTATVFALTAVSAVEGAVEGSMAESEGPLEGFITLILGVAYMELFVVMSVILGVFGVLTGLVAVLLARSSLKGQDAQEAGDEQTA